jgi:hypothetical protein
MWTYQAFMALQTADERVREADRQRLAALAHAGRVERSGPIRRSGAVVLASLSSMAASAAGRLDRRVGADLAERLGPDRLGAHN